MCTAFVSHCRITPNVSDSYVWKETGGGNVLLVQGDFILPAGEHILSPEDTDRALQSMEKVREVVEEHLEDIKTLVVYLGRYTYERAIDLVELSGIPHENIIFVTCECNFAEKRAYARGKGLRNTRWESSACGGSETINRMYANMVMCGQMREGLKL